MGAADGTVSTTTGNGNGFEIPCLSANGQFIAFYDDSTNLVSGQVDNNYHGQGTGADVFVYDQQTRTTRLVSGIDGSATATGNDRSDHSVAISADGGFIAFTSDSTNLISNQVDSNAAADVYEFNRTGGTTALVSQRDPGSPDLTPNGGSFFNDAISQDGRYVAFVSSATNLVPGQVDTNNNDDDFVYDRVTNRTSASQRRGWFGHHHRQRRFRGLLVIRRRWPGHRLRQLQQQFGQRPERQYLQ